VLVCSSLAMVSDTELVPIVDALERHGARLERVELALDFLDVPDLRAAEKRILSTLRMHDGSGPMLRPGLACTYWAEPDADANVALYVSRPSKVDPEGARAVHLELRLQGAELGRRGWRDPRALLTPKVAMVLETFAQVTCWHAPRTRVRARALAE
jgi:hypothetical protein